MLLTLSDYLKSHKSTAILGMVLLAVTIIAVLIIVNYFIRKKTYGNRREVIRRMVTIAIFSTLSIIFYKTLKFPLPFTPSFLQINFSNLPIIICAFMLGPVEGVIVTLIRTIVTVPMTGTFVVGEVADLILSTAVSITAGLVYKKMKTRKGAIIALASTVLAWVVVGVIANYFILAPAYIALFFNGDVNIFVNVLSTSIPNVTADNYMTKYIFAGVIPFNSILSVGISIITFIVYKRVSFLFHYFDKKVYSEESDEEENKIE